MKITKFKKLLFILPLATVLGLTACHSSDPNAKKVGIIVPIEHKAMTEIVNGFTETLRAKYPHPISFKIENAQGDLNLERAIIQQMKDENYDVVVPIGMDASEMTSASIHTQPIIALAASLTNADRQKLKPCNMAILHDEIAPERLVNFIHEVYPDLKQMVLIYSTSEKIYPDVKTAIATGKQKGITITGMMVPTLNDLYSTANNIPAGTQAIFVLKDNLIVSGITTLEMTANKRHIPLITSDQGSVQDGAAFALGVHERQIGVDGAKLAADILSGKSACSLPIVEMTKLTVFVNKAALEKENQAIDPVQTAAKKNHFAFELVGNGT